MGRKKNKKKRKGKKQETVDEAYFNTTLPSIYLCNYLSMYVYFSSRFIYLLDIFSLSPSFSVHFSFSFSSSFIFISLTLVRLATAYRSFHLSLMDYTRTYERTRTHTNTHFPTLYIDRLRYK